MFPINLTPAHQHLSHLPSNITTNTSSTPSISAAMSAPQPHLTMSPALLPSPLSSHISAADRVSSPLAAHPAPLLPHHHNHNHLPSPPLPPPHSPTTPLTPQFTPEDSASFHQGTLSSAAQQSMASVAMRPQGAQPYYPGPYSNSSFPAYALQQQQQQQSSQQQQVQQQQPSSTQPLLYHRLPEGIPASAAIQLDSAMSNNQYPGLHYPDHMQAQYAPVHLMHPGLQDPAAVAAAMGHHHNHHHHHAHHHSSHVHPYGPDAGVVLSNTGPYGLLPQQGGQQLQQSVPLQQPQPQPQLQQQQGQQQPQPMHQQQGLQQQQQQQQLQQQQQQEGQGQQQQQQGQQQGQQGRAPPGYGPGQRPNIAIQSEDAIPVEGSGEMLHLDCIKSLWSPAAEEGDKGFDMWAVGNSGIWSSPQSSPAPVRAHMSLHHKPASSPMASRVGHSQPPGLQLPPPQPDALFATIQAAELNAQQQQQQQTTNVLAQQYLSPASPTAGLAVGSPKPSAFSPGLQRHVMGSPSQQRRADGSPVQSPVLPRMSDGNISASRPSVPIPMNFESRRRYLFVDNGNVFVGAQSTADGSMDLALRVNVKELAELLEEGKPCMVRDVAASRPSNPRICSAWKKVGYNVHNDIAGRPARTTLASQVMRTVLEPSLDGLPQTLVLATGDGSQFPQLVSLALSKGWNVIVWSWNRCLSDKFRKLQTEYPHLVQVRLLDEFRNKITFRAAERSRNGLSSPSTSMEDLTMAFGAQSLQGYSSPHLRSLDD